MGFAKKLSGALRRRWADRRAFASAGAWGVVWYDTALRYFPRLPAPARRSVAAVGLQGVSRPVQIRLGSSDGFVMEEIFIRKVYDAATSADLGDVALVVDLGSNVGLSVRLWLERWPAAKVIAVEPDSDNYAMVMRNVGDADRGRVSAVQACVAARAGKVYLDRSREECSFNMRTQSIDGSPPVDARTLVEILESSGVNPAQEIDLLKVDIEGAEQELFADCSAWIGRVRSIFIEFHPPYGRAQFMADLERNGGRFETVWVGETAENPLLFLRRKPS